jgi:integrase/recombinase XerD
MLFDQILRKYFIFLKEAEGLSVKTIDSKTLSLDIFHKLYRGDLKKISPNRMIKLKQDIRQYSSNGKILSLKRVRRTLGDITKFLLWLSQQTGYKSKINTDIISYLSLSNEELAKTYISDRRDFPLVEQVVLMCKQLPNETLLDMRDTAIIAFLMCFGIRNETLRTLKLGCIDRISLELKQSPLDDVKTKNTKENHTFCFRFDDYLVSLIRNWVNTLYTHGFSQSDPLFPRSRFSGNIDGTFAKRIDLEKDFMRSSGTLNRILRQRTEENGFRYYSAHCFRHSCAYHALLCVENAHQLKAVSQQFSHNTVALLLTTYGNLSMHQQRETIQNMHFNYANKFQL